MDCCNYGEYRGQALAQYGAGVGWEGYGYAPLPYAPYGHAYYSPHAHDPYTRYYRYDYPSHYVHHTEHAMPMDYGAYALKETRPRRVVARREQRAHLSAQHVPLPHTPPLECGMNVRGPAYCEPQMWPHYQSGMPGAGGWNGSNVGGSWARSACTREEPMRYAPDCRLAKGSNMHSHNQTCTQEGGASHFNAYDMPYNSDTKVKCGNATESVRGMIPPEAMRPICERENFYLEQPCPPPEVKRPPVVPLPAFQQAFGSTEIGKFAEAFSRADVAHENEESENFVFESYNDWDSPPDLQWPSQPPPREIKCEDNF